MPVPADDPVQKQAVGKHDGKNHHIDNRGGSILVVLAGERARDEFGRGYDTGACNADNDYAVGENENAPFPELLGAQAPSNSRHVTPPVPQVLLPDFGTDFSLPHMPLVGRPRSPTSPSKAHPNERAQGLAEVPCTMRVHEVDERDSSWEDQNPVFRVYLFRGGEHLDASWTTWTYDIEGADLIEAAQWAQREVGNSGLYAVALVSHASGSLDEPPRKGLVWLIGNDANGDPLDAREDAAQRRMKDLRGKSITFA